jgi:hypothetical protein
MMSSPHAILGRLPQRANHERLAAESVALAGFETFTPRIRVKRGRPLAHDAAVRQLFFRPRRRPLANPRTHQNRRGPWLSEIGGRRFPGDIRHLVKHWTDDLGAFRPIGRNRLKDHFVEVILVAVKAITEIVGPLKILTA